MWLDDEPAALNQGGGFPGVATVLVWYLCFHALLFDVDVESALVNNVKVVTSIP